MALFNGEFGELKNRSHDIEVILLRRELHETKDFADKLALSLLDHLEGTASLGTSYEILYDYLAYTDRSMEDLIKDNPGHDPYGFRDYSPWDAEPDEELLKEVIKDDD